MLLFGGVKRDPDPTSFGQLSGLPEQARLASVLRFAILIRRRLWPPLFRSGRQALAVPQLSPS